MGIRAGVPPGAVRLESSRYGPGCDFSCAVSDPEPSPRPIVRSGGGRLRGFCDTRPGSIEASRHLRSVGVQRGAPTGGGPLGLRLGLCALRLARSRSFRSPDVRQKVADLQDIPAMARPGLEPGTPRFSVVTSKACEDTQSLENTRFRRNARSTAMSAICRFIAAIQGTAGLPSPFEPTVAQLGRLPRRARGSVPGRAVPFRELTPGNRRERPTHELERSGCGGGDPRSAELLGGCCVKASGAATPRRRLRR